MRLTSLTTPTAAAALSLLAVGAGACAQDPQYLDPKQNLEVNLDPTQLGMPATATMTLPIKLETPKDLAARQAMATKYGVDVPYVRVDDLAVELEWTVKNLSGTDGEARIKVDGANEYWAYIPTAFVTNPREQPEPPPLLGNIPIHVPANGQTSGVFREDELREASIDLELITRGGANPFAAILNNHQTLTSYQPTAPVDPTMPQLGTMPVGNPIPIQAFAQQIRFDVSFTADQHMVMEYGVRIRDYRGLLHAKGLAAPMGELTQFTPMDYMPPAAPAM